MKKLLPYYLIASVFIISFNTNAQLVTISATNQLPVIGNQVHYIDANTFGFDPVGTGPVTAKVWNESFLFDAGTTYDYFYVSPASIPQNLGRDSFPTANIARSESGAPGYFYYQNTANDIRRQGWFSSASNYGIYKHSTVAREFHFPITAGQTFSSTYSGNYAPLGIGEDSVRIEQGSISIVADMQGQLILPNGTYNNVLRLHVVENFHIVTYFFGIAISDNVISDDYFYWMANNILQPVLTYGVTSVDGDQQATVLRYQTFPPAGVTLNLKVFIEGLYSDNGAMHRVIPHINANSTDVDTVYVSLMNANPPHNLVSRKFGILKTNGDLSVNFGSPVVAGASYYIRIDHRNSTAIWSDAAVMMGSTTSFDFTSDN